MTQLYLASDMHLGDGSERDDFAPHTARFVDSLLEIPQGAQIILAGDVADLWRYEFKDILKHYGLVFELLAARNAVWLAGNHDRRILQPNYRDRLPKGLEFEKRMFVHGWYICHGDEFDLLNGQWFWIGKLATELISAIGMFSAKAEDTLAHWPGKLMKTGRHSRKHTFRQHALDFIEHLLLGRELCKGIVCGHTHRVANDRGYINTGLWIQDGWTQLDLGPKLGALPPPPPSSS